MTPRFVAVCRMFSTSIFLLGRSQINAVRMLRLASSCSSVLRNFKVGSCTYIYGPIPVLVKIGFYMQTYMRFSAKS